MDTEMFLSKSARITKKRSARKKPQLREAKAAAAAIPSVQIRGVDGGRLVGFSSSPRQDRAARCDGLTQTARTISSVDAAEGGPPTLSIGGEKRKGCEKRRKRPGKVRLRGRL
jgi:hypothetical protein